MKRRFQISRTTAMNLAYLWVLALTFLNSSSGYGRGRGLQISLGLDMGYVSSATASPIEDAQGASYGLGGYKGGANLMIQMGSGKRRGANHSLGLYGEAILLSNTHTEAAIFTGGTEGSESLTIYGGGLQYTLDKTIGRRSYFGFFITAGGGVYSGSIVQTGDTPQEQIYASGAGGKISGGLNIAPSKKRRGVSFSGKIGGEYSFVALTKGVDATTANTLSDISFSVVSGVLGFSMHF